MRILNVMMGQKQGGLERAALNYHQLLTSQKQDVLTIGTAGGWLASQTSVMPQYANIFAPGVLRFVQNWELRRIAEKFRPDCVIAHGVRAIRAARHIRNSRVIGVLHNTRFKPDFAKLDLMIAVSDGVARKAKLHFPNSRIEVVPNIVHVPPVLDDKAIHAPFVFGAMGRFHANKAFDNLIQAFADERVKAKQWHLNLAGAGPEEARLRSLANQLGLQDRINFTGWVEDTAHFFQGIDVFVLPSREEPFGIVVIEAMAQGVPVIATDTDGPKDIIASPSIGLLVERDNIDALAVAILAACDHKIDLTGMRKRAYEHVKHLYQFGAVGPKLVACLMSS